MPDIESLLQEKRVFKPSPEFTRQANWNKKTIAEFAENDEIVTMLRGMGIDYAQGYGIAEPKPINQSIK